MTSSDEKNDKSEKYELESPDGGWGFFVTAALALSCCVTVVPMTCFGLIFGKFLAGVGDETTGTTMSNGIFNTVFNITGLAANNLLQRYSFRFVGLLGALIFFLGNFSTVFVTNLPQMIVSFGVIQGVGMGLIFPAMFTALNSYFDKKLSLMNNISQAFMICASMAFPIIGQFLMDNYGFRGTVAILSALSLNAFLASLALQPVEWHMKKNLIYKMVALGPMEAEKDAVEEPQMKPLLRLKLEEGEVSLRPRASIISVGDRAISVATINHLGKISNKKSMWKSLVDSMDLNMFKDPVYVNIVLGLSLAFNADVAFISIIPLILANLGFDGGQIAFMVTLHFASDLVARVLLSICSVIFKINNRMVFLCGCVFVTIFRTVFLMGDSLLWKMVTISILGFLRCFVQTPLPVVISDQYSNNFSTAFSLYMVVCGFVSLILGFLMSFVKSWTGSDIIVVYLLSSCYVICIISWTVELIFKKLRSEPRLENKV